MKKLIIGLLVLGLAATAYAEKLPIRKFGGLNTRLSDYEIKNEESPDMENFTLNKAGVLTKRDLFVKYNVAALGTDSITNLYKFYTSSDAGYLICAANTQLYHATAGTLSSVVTAGTVTTGTHWGFETFIGDDGISGDTELCFAANHGTEILAWDGITGVFQDRASASGSGSPAENVNLLKKHKARLWGAGSTDYPYRIYYSSLSNGLDWVTSGGTLDLPSYEKIIALEVLSDVLYVFTRQAIYAILGSTPNEFSIVRTRSNMGSHATKSVALGDKLIFFLNKAGVFAFDGDTSVNISETIQPNIDEISSTYLDKTACLYDKRGRLWMAYTSQSGSNNDTILVYDTVIKQWYELDADFDCLFKAEGGNDRGELYAGNSDNSGWLWQLQQETAEEQITHITRTQLLTGVTRNTVDMKTNTDPVMELQMWPNWKELDNRVLILHFDGDDGATTTTDYSDEPHTFEFFYNAALDSTTKFGTATLLLDGTDDYIEAPVSDDWDIVAKNTDNWTIDFWVRFTTLAVQQRIISGHETNTKRWTIDHENSGGANDGLRFRVAAGAGSIIEMAGGEITDLEWHHVALVKKAAEYAFYKDGLQVTYLSDNSTADLENYLVIGKNRAATTYVDGRIDELRITKANIFNAYPNAAITDTIDVPYYRSSGTLHSDNLNIGAAGQASLGAITWQETLPATTEDIQFTTRTGTTDDTTYDTWTAPWVSTSTIVYQVTDPSVQWTDVSLVAGHPITVSPRSVRFYESDDSVSPSSVMFLTTPLSTDDYATVSFPNIDLSSYKFLGFWLISPTTGPSVRLTMGEITNTTVGYITADTVQKDEWEYHYWPLTYTSTDIDDTTQLRLTYLGSDDGEVRLGDIHAYDFLDSGETITSTPNNFIQYRSILGSLLDRYTPQLVYRSGFVVKINFETTTGGTETSLTSYFKTKRFDFQNEYNKMFQWVELDLETNNPTTDSTVYCDYELNDGASTGTLSRNFDVTGRRVKMRFYFPSGTSARNIQLTLRTTDYDDKLEIHNSLLSFVQGGY